MALEMEPLAEAIARADSSIRWVWTEGPYAGPYDAGQFILWRSGTKHRGSRMAVDGPGLAVFFPVQPQAGDELETPEIEP